MAYDYSTLLPHVSVDCVIFGFHEKRLKVLLLKFKNASVWTLAGGFVGLEEDVDQAAQRVLFERTGLQDIYLEQFYAFGDLARNVGAGDQHVQLQEAIGLQVDDVFLSKRFVSIGYYALVDYSKVQIHVDDVSDQAIWIDVNEIPTLFLDHNVILTKALDRLRWSLDEKLVAFNLLGDTFTMSEIQSVYEMILGRPLVRTNFQRKMLSMDILVRIEKKFSGGAHKAPYVYRLKG